MFLTIGEIAKALDMTTDNIRYYVKEGLITPQKNPENNYHEFSSDDLLKISDILFYRDLGISISNIKKIFSGIPVEEIGDVIDETMDGIQEQMKELSRAHSQLQTWKEYYQMELASIGKCSVTMMPAIFTSVDEFTGENHIANHLKAINIPKDEWINMSMTFYIDGRKPEQEQTLKWFVSLIKTEKTMQENLGNTLKDFDSVPCIRTCVHLSQDIHEMTNGIRQYAEKEGLKITGEFYGWEQTNYYQNNKRMGVYSVFAPLK